MKSTALPDPSRYALALVRAEYDSPIDALLALGVPRDEAMDLVAASWCGSAADCIVTVVHGGRSVAVLSLPARRWAACNVFQGKVCATPHEAERRLERLLRRGRPDYVGMFSLQLAGIALPGSGAGELASVSAVSDGILS
jgi:hypothetical protein